MKHYNKDYWAELKWKRHDLDPNAKTAKLLSPSLSVVHNRTGYSVWLGDADQPHTGCDEFQARQLVNKYLAEEAEKGDGPAGNIVKGDENPWSDLASTLGKIHRERREAAEAYALAKKKLKTKIVHHAIGDLILLRDAMTAEGMEVMARFSGNLSLEEVQKRAESYALLGCEVVDFVILDQQDYLKLDLEAVCDLADRLLQADSDDLPDRMAVWTFGNCIYRSLRAIVQEIVLKEKQAA